ncbi:hypothetical protein [uncultured Winogradskyella sp.]|jgi:hypothetical protein|uniref:hypothetical protein n=1 Tax=uncultured Winogradskyella sp. TaxID=395353 RepID=UPI0030DB7D4C|tara:strand:+ start:1800 stop:2873 length:1074 start_codon:yes stop_codon:yes gene_type:complete
MFKKWITFSGILLFVTTLGLLSYNINAAEAQTGTGCTNGTDNCENNNLTTVNSTTTTNTNTNTSTATNTNNNTNTNANTNVNTTTTTATNTANNTNVNTNANTNVNTSTATSTATSNNTNTNANTNVNTSTSTNTSNVTQAVTNNTTSNNTSSNTSTSANTNTNVNNSTSESNVTTDNTNTNNNNINANNTNTNVNQSSSTQVIEQRVKSPPASAIAPSIMSYSQDLCTTGRSGALQGQLFGFSGGTTVRDMNCERLKLSKYLYDMGMKVASVSLLCQDNRVFQAMEMAGTPCPYKGKIGKEATAAWASNTDERPDSEGLYDAFMKKCWLSPNKKGVSKSKRTCKKEWKKQNATQEG